MCDVSSPFFLYQSIAPFEIWPLVWPECLMLSHFLLYYSFISYFVVFRYTSSLSLCWELTSALLHSLLRSFPIYTAMTNLKNKLLLPSFPSNYVYFLIVVICYANSRLRNSKLLKHFLLITDYKLEVVLLLIVCIKTSKEKTKQIIEL